MKKKLVSTCIQTSQKLQWTFKAKISLYKVTNSVNSQTNNKSQMAQHQSYKYFSTELSRILLDVYNSFEKLCTMGATSGIGIISAICKFWLQHFTTIFKNHVQKALDAITVESQSDAIKNRTILNLFSTIQDVIDVSCNLYSNFVLILLNFC